MSIVDQLRAVHHIVNDATVHPDTACAAFDELMRLVPLACDELERLADEVAAFRKAVVEGDGPSCEDVCLHECIGVCGAAETWNTPYEDDD